jgi:Protein of unknown function (DUF3011)
MARVHLVLGALLVACSTAAIADSRYDDRYDDGYDDRYDDRAQNFNCESQNQRTVYCRVDRGRDVRFLRQNSRAACIEGQTWGWDRGGVWVSGGCRAEFAVGQRRDGWGSGWNGNGWNSDGWNDDGWNDDRDGSSRNGLVRCESSDARGGYCRADTSRGVRLANQFSRAQCVEGQSWGYDRGGIWVSHGCRAEFLLAGNGQGGWNGGNGGIRRGSWNDRGSHRGRITCESQDGRYVFCRASGVRQVRLDRQLSRGACVQNETWGYRSDGIWVSNGCRGEFALD